MKLQGERNSFKEDFPQGLMDMIEKGIFLQEAKETLHSMEIIEMRMKVKVNGKKEEVEAK